MEWKNTLMIYQEEVKERSFIDWLKAHTSFMKPLHRYKGILKLEGRNLIFIDKNKNEKIETKLDNIKEVSLGFDKIFTGWEERAAPWNKPLKIVYNKTDEKKETIYLFANFHHRYGIRTSDNKEVRKKLKNSLINEKGTYK